MALSDPEGLEEEGRLFFVALTRARRSLSIYIPVRYYHHPDGRDDAHGYGKHSRFLSEQAEALCERSTIAAERQGRPLMAGTNAARVTVDLSDLWR